METYHIKSNKYFPIYLFIALIFVVGCKKDWLDEKSDLSLVVPTSLTDLQGLLDNSITMTQVYPILGEIASDGHYFTDAIIQSVTSSNIIKKDAYLWEKTIIYSSVSDWNTSYQKVLIDNIVLEGLNKIIPANENEQKQWNNIRGQALFNRANVFFQLAQTYAPVYNSGTSATDLGIVLKLTSDVTSTSKRSTVKMTYEQILKDLTEAKFLLDSRPSILTRSSSTATDALLSRVYLCLYDYVSAFTSADNCLQQYSQLLDYNEVSSTANFIGRYNKEVLMHTNYTPVIVTTTNNLIDRSLFDLYKQEDLRKTRFYRLNANQTVSFKGNYDSVTDKYFNGFATDEVYLTRAECYARAGKTIEALKDLNDLLVKRWDKNAPYQAVTANNAEDALYKILEERKKELIFRGVRWMDLRRLNKDSRFAVTLKRTVLGVEYTLEPNSYKYTFPIPDDIIVQTGIAQNPGWP